MKTEYKNKFISLNPEGIRLFSKRVTGMNSVDLNLLEEGDEDQCQNKFISRKIPKGFKINRSNSNFEV